MFQIQLIERFTKVRIQRAKVPTATEVEEAKVGALLTQVRATLQKPEFRRHEHLIERLLEEGFPCTDIACAVLHLLQEGQNQPATPGATASGGSEPSPRSFESRPPREERRPREDRPPERAGEHRQAPWARQDRPARPGGDRPDRARGYDRPSDARPAFRDTRDMPRPARAPDREDRPVRQFEKPASPPARPAAARVPKTITPPPGRKPVAAAAPVAEPKPAPSAETPAVPDAAPPTKRVSGSGPFARKPGGGKPIPGGKPGDVEHSPKHSRRTPEDQARLYLNLGAEMGIGAADVKDAIMGHTGLPGEAVGTVDIRERHLFVDVEAQHANAIISKLNRSTIKGTKVKAKIA